jgi:hypothetical protein
LRRHGYYWRKHPRRLGVARWYCPTERVTISVLPDFLASRFSGTLDEAEAAVAAYESAATVSAAADAVRPPETASDGATPVTLEATTRWLRRRVKLVRACLLAVAGLFPELFSGCEATVAAFRARLETESVLVMLRGIASDELAHLPPPLGFGPLPQPRRYCKKRDPHKACPERPP